MSFLNFHYGRSSKPTPIRRKKTSSSQYNYSNTERRSSSFDHHQLPSMEELRWAFEKFDTNKDGRISRQEYKSALRVLDREMTDSEIAKAFQALDSDGDGSIDFKEFVEMFNMGSSSSSSGDRTKAADIESAFRVFDIDGDGRISAEELSQVLKNLGEGCSMRACRNMIKGADVDGDGFINMDEFVTMMSTNRKQTNLNY
ncbi:calcium-binding protein CML24-like [Humulus lupulus]|uniref:calcium-binding protein CML24-like n=1 Tax=Humulus lupulus TaxID=3486 RepID=UPI002B411827|nr:calcium-binding protein CML24-like [Humulus lupulus]